MLHLGIWEADPLLECDRVGVGSRVNGFGYSAVGAVGADDDVGREGLGFSAGVVVDEIRVVRGAWEGEGGEEAVEEVSAVGNGAVAEEGIEDLTAEHGNVLAGEEGGAEVGGEVGGGDDAHAGDAAVD